MKLKIYLFTILIICIFSFAKISFSQEKPPTMYDKNITLGISSVISNPYFLNAFPDIGFRLYNNITNMGIGINTKLLIRFKYDNFIVSITDIKAYKRVKFVNSSPLDLGMGIGIGINSSPHFFLLTSMLIGIPVWKLHIECQPNIVIPTVKSSYINLGIAYYLKQRKNKIS